MLTLGWKEKYIYIYIIVRLSRIYIYIYKNIRYDNIILSGLG